MRQMALLTKQTGQGHTDILHRMDAAKGEMEGVAWQVKKIADDNKEIKERLDTTNLPADDLERRVDEIRRTRSQTSRPSAPSEPSSEPSTAVLPRRRASNTMSSSGMRHVSRSPSSYSMSHSQYTGPSLRAARGVGAAVTRVSRPANQLGPSVS